MKIKALLKNHKIASYQMSAFFFFFLAIFLIFNIVSSQMISPVYFRLLDGGRDNVVQYLKNIRGLAVFDTEIKKYEEVYGNSLDNLVFDEERSVGTKINKFEQILKRNTYSRDILYSLYLLEKQKGDQKSAEDYLLKVRQIDPSFK